MWVKALPWMHRVFRRWSAKHPRVEIKRGDGEQLLVLIDGQRATLTHPETLSTLKAAGSPVVRALGQVLETGSPEARVEAAWLLGQIGSEAAIPALRRVLERAGSWGDVPVMLRRTTEALLRLGPTGLQAFDQALRLLAPDDLTRLLLIRHATDQLLGTSPRLPLSPEIKAEWRWALTLYLRRLEWLDRLSRLRRADKVRAERVVLEAYGVSLQGDRQAVPTLIEALTRYSAQATDEAEQSG